MTLVIADFLTVKTDHLLIQMAANRLITRAISVFPVLPRLLRVETNEEEAEGTIEPYLYEPFASSSGESVDSDDLSRLNNTDW